MPPLRTLLSLLVALSLLVGCGPPPPPKRQPPSTIAGAVRGGPVPIGLGAALGAGATAAPGGGSSPGGALPIGAEAGGVVTYTSVNPQNYFDEVVLASVRQPVLVMFYRDNYQRRSEGQIAVDNMKVVYERLAREFRGRIKFTRFNVRSIPERNNVQKELGVKALPSTAMYKDGKMIDMLRGGPLTTTAKSTLEKILEEGWIPTNITNPNCKAVLRFNNTSQFVIKPYNICK